MTETPAATAPAVLATPNFCACDCGKETASPKSTFLQGHDQKLVSQIAYTVVDGEATDRMLGWPGMEDWDESADIQARIIQICDAVAEVFSDKLAAKADAACMRRWDLSVKRTTLQEEKAAKKAAVANRKPAAKNAPVEEILDQLAGLDASTATGFAKTEAELDDKVGLGSGVKAKIGRWTKDATVHGMNQAGKVTAVSFRDAKGNLKTTEKFTLVD